MAENEWIFILVAIVFIFFGAKKIPGPCYINGKATDEYERARIDDEKELK